MVEWIAAFIEKVGYSGIGLLMLAENVVPPIPSELIIMPLAGVWPPAASLMGRWRWWQARSDRCSAP